MRTELRAAALVFAGLATAAMATEAAATTWLVPGDMSNTCTVATPSCDTIQGAVTAAASGDDIQVAAGTYPTGTILVDKSLTIVGAGAASTFVEPTGVGFSIAADDVVLQDLTVRNGTQGVLFGTSGVSNVELNGVHLTNNSSRGIEIQATVSDIRVVDGELTGNNVGIRMASTSNVDGLDVIGTTFTNHTLAIYQANDGNTSQLNDLNVSESSFVNNTSTAAIYAEEIRNSVIEDSTFTTNQRGILVFKFFTGSGVPVENVTIRNNQFSGSTVATIQVQEQAQGLAGPIDVVGNTITQDVGLLTANVGAIDVRLGSALTHTASVNVTDNTVTLSGSFAAATAAHGIAIRGNGPVVVTGNDLDGGSVGGTATNPPSSGIYVRSTDSANPAFGAIPSGATIGVGCNRITGFTNGVSIYDTVAAAFGGLQAGVALTINDNVIAGNTAGLVNGPNPPTIDAEENWWGCAAGPGNPGCESVTGDVDFTPVASAPPACVACTADADCDDGLACNGAETCNLGTEMCESGTPVVCDDGNDCTADACAEPAGSCVAPPEPDGTSCDDGITCSIPDSCQSGVCDGGGTDANANDVCDEDEVGPLAVQQVVIKAQRAGAGNGKVIAKASFVTAPPGDTLDASGPITLRAEDLMTVDVQYTWPVGECTLRGPAGRQKVVCKSADRKSKATFKPDRQVTNGFKLKAKLGNLAIDPPFAGPAVLTLTYGPGTVRSGSIAACVAKPTSLKCKAP
jgi:hypothetical protein